MAPPSAVEGSTGMLDPHSRSSHDAGNSSTDHAMEGSLSVGKRRAKVCGNTFQGAFHTKGARLELLRAVCSLVPSLFTNTEACKGLRSSHTLLSLFCGVFLIRGSVW